MTNLDIDKIRDDISRDGYVVMPNFLTTFEVEKILAEFDAGDVAPINRNWIAPVDFFGQTFFCNVLAESRLIFNIVTSAFVFSLAEKYLGQEFRLKSERYYESGYDYQLGWHTDNKTVDGRFTSVRGIVFIIYLSDTYNQGYLEVLRGSNTWSKETKKNSFSEAEVIDKYLDLIIPIPGGAGTLVITDTLTIHRTNRITAKNYRRKSLFFQVDDDLKHGERLLVNPEFFTRLDKKILEYLGFGFPAGYRRVPGTNIKTLTNRNLVFLGFSIMLEVGKRIPGLSALKHLISKLSSKI